MKVALVGSGNTATVLARLLVQSKHEVVKVVSRTLDNARTLATQVNADYGDLNDSSFGEADLYIISLADQALNNLAKFTPLHGKFIAHTAGAVSINALKECSDRCGILYPLQTLSKFVNQLPEIPFLVDGSNDETLGAMLSLANSISPNVSHATDKQRLAYHIAAVFSANFSNHMYALAEIYCQKEHLDFKTLLPLIKEVCCKVTHYSPFLTQTGPGIRNDVMTISKHLETLSPYPDLKYMYLKMTENIMKLHGKR